MDGSKPDVATQVKIIWGLYILSAAAGITAVIGVVLAYVWRDADRGHPLNSHFERQIRVFWITALVALVGLVLTIIGVGFLLLFAASAYMAVMAVIGLVKAFGGRPWS